MSTLGFLAVMTGLLGIGALLLHRDNLRRVVIRSAFGGFVLCAFLLGCRGDL